MFLPKKASKNLQNSRGQVLILFLLILVVGLAIVLSIASRTATDTRTTTTSDESNRAYFAAEAGIEEALRQLQDTGSIGTVDLKFDESNSSATTVAADSPGSPTFVYPNDLEKDEVAQVNMLGDLSNPASGWTGSVLNFYWGYTSFASDQNQAIEITIVSYDTATSSFSISKFGLDPNSSHGNNFCTIGSGVSEAVVPLLGKTFNFNTTINLFGPAPCSNQGPPISGTPVLIRIRAMYNSKPIPVAVQVGSGEPNLPSQSVVVTSTGTTASGVTRKLKVTRLYPAMPALFDYVLFNGSSSKPLKK